MSDKNNNQELEKTTDATADEVTSETETNDTIESVPADSVQFSVTFDDVDDESTVDDGIYSALASAETGETDETSEAGADAIASVNASAEVTERNAARVNETSDWPKPITKTHWPSMRSLRAKRPNPP